MRIISAFVLGLIFQFASAQNIEQPGVWHDFFSYRTPSKIVIAKQRTYFICANALFYFDGQDSAIHRLSKVNGLSDVGLQTSAYSNEIDAVIVVYKNCNIDILYQQSGQIVNIPDIIQKQLYGDKTVTDVICDKNLAYLVMNFGIVVVDLKRKEIKDSYFFQNDIVNKICVTDSLLYVATKNGILSCDQRVNNPADNSTWKKLTQLPKLEYRNVFKFNNQILVEAAHKDEKSWYDTLYTLNGDSMSVYSVQDGYMLKVFASGNRLISIRGDYAFIYDENKRHIKTVTYRNEYINDIQIDATDAYWAIENGFRAYFEKFQKPIIVNSPIRDAISDMKYAHNALYMCHGQPFSKNYIYASIFMNDTCAAIYDWQATDGTSIAVSQDSLEHIYISSSGGPLTERHKINSKSTYYNESNSALHEAWSGAVRTNNIIVDSKNNLYAGIIAPKPIVVKTKDGKWYSWTYAGLGTSISNPMIDRNNVKWFVTDSYSEQILVFNDNGTFETQSDDKFRILSLINSDGESTSGNATCFAQDQDGVLWVGTNTGIVTYSNPDRIFSDKLPRFNGIKVETNGYIDYLLHSDYITCIYVDAANRKWIGTKSSGVFLVSANGEEQILHFTAQNSPLPSNYVTKICIDGRNGEVFIGTQSGSISYMGTALNPSSTMDNIVVFPNPVKPSYQGLIYIDGLAANTEVKITDMAGNLVYETLSYGGRAVWDGKNMNGNRVTTGVYMVFCSNSDGSVTGTAKIFFVQ